MKLISGGGCNVDGTCRGHYTSIARSSWFVVPSITGTLSCEGHGNTIGIQQPTYGRHDLVDFYPPTAFQHLCYVFVAKPSTGSDDPSPQSTVNPRAVNGKPKGNDDPHFTLLFINRA
jgi:hypothetical protein